jgi:release factor glutamine methyltransferase
LVAAGCVAATAEATLLAAAAADRAELEAMVARREQGEPLAWITGSVSFCGRSIHVAPGVYVPRAQSEALAERAARSLPPGGRAVDLCTGSGAIAAHLRWRNPTALVVGVEVDPTAAACARRNGVAVVLGDLASPLRGGLDVVTRDLGYLPADVQRFEPQRALDGGPDGLDLVRRVVDAAGTLLRPGGRLLLEVGGSQDEALAPALAGAGFGSVETWRDDEGDLRGLDAQR